MPHKPVATVWVHTTGTITMVAHNAQKTKQT